MTVISSINQMSSNHNPPTTEWHPSRLFTQSPSTPTPPQTPYAIIILNQPINERVYSTLSAKAIHILCADGAANHFHDQFLLPQQRRLFQDPLRTSSDPPRLPTAVVGDLDSLRPDVATALRQLGVIITKDPDQYSTDFGKCLKWLVTHPHPSTPKSTPTPDHPRPDLSTKPVQLTDSDGRAHPMDVVVLTGLGGRVDQALSTLHELYTHTAHHGAHRAALDPTGDRTGITHTAAAAASGGDAGLNPSGEEGQGQGDQEKWTPRGDESNAATQRLAKFYLLTPSSLSFILAEGSNKISLPRSTLLHHPLPGTPPSALSPKKEHISTSNPPPRASNHHTSTTSTTETAPPSPPQSFFPPPILPPSNPPLFTPTIGILPLPNPCHLSTTGLEWDVRSWRTAFGSGLMSTSNHVRAGVESVDVLVSFAEEEEDDDGREGREEDHQGEQTMKKRGKGDGGEDGDDGGEGGGGQERGRKRRVRKQGPLFTIELTNRFKGGE